MPDFIGGDPESNASECPAVFVIPETGDFVFRGKTITDPALIAELNEHIGKAEDESDVWLPARMAPFIRDALDGYEQGREGPGQHTFAELLAATSSSVIRFEMRDSYDENEQGFAEWQATAVKFLVTPSCKAITKRFHLFGEVGDLEIVMHDARTAGAGLARRHSELISGGRQRHPRRETVRIRGPRRSLLHYVWRLAAL